MVQSKSFWDRKARGYAKSKVRDQAAYERTLERVRHYLDKEMDVLEFGAGTGTTALLLADSVGHITSTDISSEMIAIAKEKIADGSTSNVSFHQANLADWQQSGLGDKQYDCVMAFNLLHLIEDLPSALCQIHKLVKPGGLFISKSVCLGGGVSFWRVPIFFMQMVGQAPHVSFLTIDKLETAIEAAGFEIVEQGNYPAKPVARFIVSRRELEIV